MIGWGEMMKRKKREDQIERWQRYEEAREDQREREDDKRKRW